MVGFVQYQPRVVDSVLADRLASAGAVVIEGPKACGKTATASQVAASSVLLDIDTAAADLASVAPDLLLEGATPRLFDEWQTVPKLWNLTRRAVDERGIKGQFILTGSAVPGDDTNRHTGAGRFSFISMRPMSLYESGQSAGTVSLTELMHGEFTAAGDPGLAFTDLVDATVRGGWPAQRDAPVEAAAQAARDYLKQTQEVDLGRVGLQPKNPAKVGRLLASLARNVATEASVATLASDTGNDETVDRKTINGYLDALTRLMIVEDQPAWAPHLRSKARLRNAAKRHFVDPSLAVAALATNPKALIGDLNYFGFLFESLVIRDLRILSQPLGGAISHYRDSSGQEVDAIVELDDGTWAAFEVKLSPDRADEAAASLLAFVEGVDTTKIGKPAALAVITASGYGYRRDDGVHVVPLATLAP